MKRYQKYLTPALALLFLCAAPFVTDGLVNNASCCNLASSLTSSMFQGGNGDEDFFAVPGGPPNVVFLLDNSGSMNELPNPPPVPPNGTGTCTGTWLNNYTALRTSVPYDNGYTTSLLTDSPPWGTAKCSGSTCLFVGTSYYRYQDWSDDSATPRTSAAACSGALPNVATCQACLDSAGYYVWNSGGTGYSAYKGDFLNGYPPKYIVARKVVKDLVSIDDAHPSPLDNVRFGLVVFDTNSGSCGSIGSSLQACDGGHLIVPLGPNCDAYPMTNALQQVPRQAIINAINDATKVPFGGYTPLAETLFNIGQYYSNNTGTLVYPTAFGSGWTNSEFIETAGGSITASWTGTGKNQKSVCWACQQNSVIIVTDGEPTKDNNLPKPGVSTHSAFGTGPNADFRNWSNGTINCPTCGTDGGGSGVPNLLHKVAYFLYQTDMRNDYTGTQNVLTYTVSFGLDPVANSAGYALLQKTADLGQGSGAGGGLFANASNGDELNQAMYNALTDVVSRATSFSNSNTSTLQTQGRTQIFLTRFRPHSDPTWEGHVYRFNLFYEFAMGCDSTKPQAQQPTVTCNKKGGGTKSLNANLNGDTLAGNAVCDGLFKLDGDCDPVMEDADGNFVKATFDASGLLVATATPANPFWDAGQVLSDPTMPGYRSANESAANKRLIWTVVDADADGQFTAADGLTAFTAANAATLAPLMQLDPSWCLSLLQRASLCGTGAAPACPTVAGWTAANTTQCAQQIVHFIRGWDVMDQDGDNCAGPGNPNNTGCPAGQDGEERDRTNDTRADQTFFKLGDVFHSSPIVVEPPVDEFTCDLAFDNQCVATLHSPQALTLAVQTPMDCPGATCDVNGNGTLDPGEDAYSMYRKNNLGRQQLVLVGGNDGMLHAFDAGLPDGNPAGPFGYTYTAGTGAELWAFIPPDLLPKLKNAIDNHDYFVDGDVMVRDIWYDANKDGKKQPSEFHTVAVISERSGGSVFTALDVTDPVSPQFRWAFPKLCTNEVNLVGQSWTGFAPRAPPIGPVQIALPYTNGPVDAASRGFEERWVVGLNGGYDPGLTRGKGVWIADAWTGDVLWGFTNDDFQNNVNSAASMWPVPASPALVDLGKSGDATAQYDGFFDSLTWADLGGQMFVARLDPPGTLDPVTGRVTNWAAARFFEEQRQANDSQTVAGRSEFYFMPANAVDGVTKFLHTYVGSGNREHILQVGPGCSPDNVLACCQAGCTTVDVTSHFNYAGGSNCDVTQHFSCQGGVLREDKSVQTGTCGAFQCGGLNATVQMHLACGAAGTPPDVIAHLKCDSSGKCCQTIGDGTCTKVTKGRSLNPSKLTAPTNHSRFYGIWSYGGPRAFGTTSNFATTLTQAKTLDQNRFTDITFAGTCTGPTGSSCTAIQSTQALVNSAGGVTCGGGVTTCSATSYDPGWFYEYGDVCPLSSCSPAPPWLDEKTGSAADVIAGCTVWNTFRPLGAGISMATTPCTTSSGVPQNYNYVANAVSGVPDTKCGYQAASAIYRASYRQAVAPPLAPTMLMGISGGKVQAASGQPGDPGAPPPGGDKAKAMGGTRALSQQGYWLEVPRDLHQCRHVDPTQCN